jgi:hypothetical protein
LIDAELLESFRQFHRRRAHPSQYTIEDKRQFLGFATQVYKDGAGHSGINAVLGARPYVIPKEIHAMSGEKMGFVAGGLYSRDSARIGFRRFDWTRYAGDAMGAPQG